MFCWCGQSSESAGKRKQSSKKNTSGSTPILRVDPDVLFVARSALDSPSGRAGSPNGLTERVSCVILSTPMTRTAPPQLRVRSAAFNSGMIATGNHNFERFAALCNTPVGAPRALRAGCICVLFYLGTVSSALSYVRFLSGIVTGRVREPTYGYRVRSGIKKHPSRLCTR